METKYTENQKIKVKPFRAREFKLASKEVQDLWNKSVRNLISDDIIIVVFPISVCVEKCCQETNMPSYIEIMSLTWSTY